MIVNTDRRKPGKSIRERVAQQLEAQRRERMQTCNHNFIGGRCTRCPATAHTAR